MAADPLASATFHVHRRRRAFADRGPFNSANTLAICAIARP